MKYLYKSLNIEVEAIRFDGSNHEDVFDMFQCNIVQQGDRWILDANGNDLLISTGDWIVGGINKFNVLSPEGFSEKFEPIRKMRVVRKNNKTLLKRRGKGFWGRVLPVQFGDNYLVLQNKRCAGRDVAVMTYFDFEPTEGELYRLRQLFLKKYKLELGKLISFDQFCGAVQNGKQCEREFEQVSKQTKLEL